MDAYVWEIVLVGVFSWIFCLADVQPKAKNLQYCLSFELFFYAMLVAALGLLVALPGVAGLGMVGFATFGPQTWLAVAAVFGAWRFGAAGRTDGPIVHLRAAAVATAYANKARRAAILTEVLLRSKSLRDLRQIAQLDETLRSALITPKGVNEKVHLACVIAKRNAGLNIDGKAAPKLGVLGRVFIYLLLPLAINLIAAKIDHLSTGILIRKSPNSQNVHKAQPLTPKRSGSALDFTNGGTGEPK